MERSSRISFEDVVLFIDSNDKQALSDHLKAKHSLNFVKEFFYCFRNGKTEIFEIYFENLNYGELKFIVGNIKYNIRVKL